MKNDLRDVMRNFATGVCVISTYSDRSTARRHDAITANSLTSVSLEPPLVSISLRSDSGFLADLMESEVWGISILDSDSEDVARSFSRPREDREEALRELPVEVGEQTGVLLLDAPGRMECRFRDYVVAGDHIMVIGEVVGLGVRDGRSPLIFLQGGFHRFEEAQV
ncbi:flavin reductase family protein [Kitasatospora sp. MAP5-34]|uniref:flavin reductase family protein n=1 Tax=Kitasatospora sp. MAP5-34 TaxID=3035102 RepID=UPI002472F303|nr:flavin reductase family protein [Kitasatospora sp. MAP5-34]MDH6577487.1 flavin reductase (DIM6/NTAB) family NADH-FMN oxidoreductase RutF [Kitasatospora sp. MAP5-34]